MGLEDANYVHIEWLLNDISGVLTTSDNDRYSGMKTGNYRRWAFH